MRDIFFEYRCRLSIRTLSEMTNDKINVSQHTIFRLLHSDKWKAVRERSIPTCTERHREMRLQFVSDYEHQDFRSDCLWVDIDEKYFYLYNTGDLLYVPTDMVSEFQRVERQTKTKIPGVMFFGAVSRPYGDFDGKVLLKPILEEHEMKNGSRYAAAGEIVVYPSTMAKKEFIDVCTIDLAARIEEICLKLKLPMAVVQCDRAGGHGGGRGDMVSTLKEINRITQHNFRIPITFIAQSAKSPDFNVLDLGIWNSIQCGVRCELVERNYTGTPRKQFHHILDAVKERWNSWNSAEVLEKAFNTKMRIFAEVKRLNGTNDYTIPRSGNSHAKDTASYNPEK
jgi:hypothetical protein